MFMKHPRKSDPHLRTEI